MFIVWVMVKIHLRRVKFIFKLLFYFSIEEKVRIIDFYKSDEYSHQLPWMKNVKSVKQLNGKLMKKQEWILLVNIYVNSTLLTKKYSPTCVVCKLSAFFENRPAYVINVGAHCIHSVCVCLYHQNVNFMLDAIDSLMTRYSISYINIIVMIIKVCSSK